MKKVRLSILFGILSALGIYFIAESTLSNLLPENTDLTLPTVLLTGQTFLMVTILSILGLNMLPKTGLRLYQASSNGTVWIKAALAGVGVGFFIQALDALYFADRLEALNGYQPESSLSAMLGGVLYGGVGEEVLIRLFLMTLIVWTVTKLKRGAAPSNMVYIVAILISSLVFAIGHLPANLNFFGELSTMVVFRALLLNGVGGILFGWLYWKHGLVLAIFAHMIAHISMHLIFIPILF